MILLNLILIWLAYTLIISNLNIKKWHNYKTLSCGLIGYSGPEPFDKSKLKILFYISALERGQDSTGLYTPKNGLLKSTDAGYDIAINDEEWDKIKDDNFFIGHVRAKTHGAATKDNAHPFQRSTVILAHNGTLTNHIDLKYKYDLKSGVSYEVDSDILCGSIAKSGNIKPIGEINGSAALLIHSTLKKYERTLFIFRKGSTIEANKRPLFRGNIGPNVYICSISEALQLIGCVNIKSFDEDYLYTMKDGVYVNEPYKITNQPYSKPYIPNTTHTNHNFITFETKKLLHQVVRFKNLNQSIYVEGEEPVIINKNTEIKITKIIDNNNFEYKVLNRNYSSSGLISNIDKETIIEKGKIVVANEDIIDRFYTNQVLLKKGGLAIISNVFGDEDVNIELFHNNYLNTLEFGTRMIKKSNVRVATEEQSKFYTKCIEEGYKENPNIAYMEQVNFNQGDNNSSDNSTPHKLTIDVLVEKLKANKDSKITTKLSNIIPFKLSTEELKNINDTSESIPDIVVGKKDEKHPLDKNVSIDNTPKVDNLLLTLNDDLLVRELFQFFTRLGIKVDDLKVKCEEDRLSREYINILEDIDKLSQKVYDTIFYENSKAIV